MPAAVTRLIRINNVATVIDGPSVDIEVVAPAPVCIDVESYETLPFMTEDPNNPGNSYGPNYLGCMAFCSTTGDIYYHDGSYGLAGWKRALTLNGGLSYYLLEVISPLPTTVTIPVGQNMLFSGGLEIGSGVNLVVNGRLVDVL